MWNKIDILKFLWWTIPILVSFYSLYQSNEAIKYSKDQAEASKKQVTISETQLTEEKIKSKIEIINNIKNELADTKLITEIDNSFFDNDENNFTKNDFVNFSKKLEMISTAYNGKYINEDDIKDNFSQEIKFICRNFSSETDIFINRKIETLCKIAN